MTLRISGKSISVGEALRARVTERTDEVLRKYFDGNYSGHITLSKDGFSFRTDCSLHLDSGITLEADSNATDAYASADAALLMIEKRLRRYKSRLKDRSARKTYAASMAIAELNGGGLGLDAPSYIIEAPEGGERARQIEVEGWKELSRSAVDDALGVRHGKRVPAKCLMRRRLMPSEVVRRDRGVIVVSACVPRLLEQAPCLFRLAVAFHPCSTKKDNRVVRVDGHS